MSMNAGAATTRRGFVRLALGAAVAGPLAASAGCSVLNGSSGSSSAGGGSAAGLEKSKLTIGILHSQGSAPAKLAEKYGYFTQQGLQVTLKSFSAGPQAFTSLQNGELDFAVTNYVSFFQAVVQNTLDAKIVVEGNTANENSVVLVAKPDSGITGAKDLVGKKIGIQQAASVAELLVRATLKDNDVDPNSPHYLPVKFPDIPAQIAGGQLDAGVEVEPYLTTAEQKQGVQPVLKIVTGSTANMPQTGYIALSKFVDANPKTVAAFQRAMIPAQSDASDRKKLAEVLPDLSGVDRVTAALLNIDAYPTSVNTTQLQRVITLMQSYGGLTAKLDATKLVVPTPQA
ncbi:MAG TPA: ABC transporter substrate-binding protein [Amycolatopsis sp.]|uniref:ABC transporter substrate-binding protein n=1 Tax=Amycolatopsis sp. TaxID=37632 RepID=UPI002B4A944F|nr:ABC transporter substrate-binding protein [Amycolatopsis sp.]HKS45148.1 ABC transporter substrate-binding protein [Amycolatopsis sp.]